MIPKILQENSLLFDNSRSEQEKNNIFSENVHDIATAYICNVYYSINNALHISNHSTTPYLYVSPSHFNDGLNSHTIFYVNRDYVKVYEQACINIYNDNIFYVVPIFDIEYNIVKHRTVHAHTLHEIYPFLRNKDVNKIFNAKINVYVNSNLVKSNVKSIGSDNFLTFKEKIYWLRKKHFEKMEKEIDEKMEMLAN